MAYLVQRHRGTSSRSQCYSKTCLPARQLDKRDRDCASDLDHYTYCTAAIEGYRRNSRSGTGIDYKKSVACSSTTSQRTLYRLFLSQREINKPHTINFHFLKLPSVLSQRLLLPTVIYFPLKFIWSSFHTACVA